MAVQGALSIRRSLTANVAGNTEDFRVVEEILRG